MVRGTGSKIIGIKQLKNRTKKKIITQNVALNLVKIFEEREDFEELYSSWNTFHCQSKLVSSGRTLYGYYCKNRVCNICNGNRKAGLIKKYKPIIESWEEPFFTTLTVKSVTADELKSRINKMYKVFKLIVGKYKKRNQRGSGIKLIGIKSLECNFNSVKKTYNPHFHIIVPNRETYMILMKEWRHYWGESAGKAGQLTRKIKHTEKHLIEAIKYGTKIFTSPDPNNKSNRTKFIYVAAIANIVKAMKGHRIFDRFGFNLPKSEKYEGKKTLLDKCKHWEFDTKLGDWENPDKAEVLSNYKPEPELCNMLENNIDTKSE